ncbi:hypothetical protein BFL34_01731 [Clavibacter michiganensis]|uniref:Uncharacterized protein n=1 Tax=Clavibacter michiganensis TaxID=28447 RepID=A0A251Y9V7_9MICO|nr:hypothetical protein [Clavibacter michiganensis]OUE20913.1 hypothetical protein BFL34_01731 [Clavibacter michiganensis]
MSAAAGLASADAPPVVTAGITGLGDDAAPRPAPVDADRAAAGSDGERFVTLASSPHAADWGRALSRALEYITVKVALRDGVAEADALVGRTVTLHVDPAGHGVRIAVELAPVPAAAAPGPEPELDLGID